MELEIDNELLIESNNFYIKICPIETELNYLPSFRAKIDCKISPTIKLQYNYSDRLWFAVEDFDKFVTDVRGIVAGTREVAELKSMSLPAIFIVSKYGNHSKCTINIDGGLSVSVDDRIQITTSFIQQYDFINILSRAVTEFWGKFKCLLKEGNP
ncbi:hypothetical protein [Coleofasciculus sp. FACHB-SPT36]|uniref:hypothetical protein n=1 Tax=Cyanophyceae TaxID=3028117 RepID=UPI00168AC727|nr:hypothetical protein [Coleofasciculus sp. FACHB-SPT36]MBD2541722.1 hypothetical protein [Coleofasciculus sp. FACHB-SPT36]